MLRFKLEVVLFLDYSLLALFLLLRPFLAHPIDVHDQLAHPPFHLNVHVVILIDHTSCVVISFFTDKVLTLVDCHVMRDRRWILDVILVLLFLLSKEFLLLEVIVDEKVLGKILVRCPFDLVIDVHGEVLAEDLWLVILVCVVLWLVVLCAWPWLVFVTDKELVEDLQKLLNLIKRLKQLIFLIILSVCLLPLRLLSLLVQ